MSDDGFARFGTPDRFAVDLRLVPDPDRTGPDRTGPDRANPNGDERAPAVSCGSWGQWRLWVQGRNLCRYEFHAQGQGQAPGTQVLGPQAWVTWYLAPLLRWLAENWGGLLHEQRFPGGAIRATAGARQTARDAYLASLHLIAEDGPAFMPWQAWGQRHSLRRAAEGGIVPDLFLRRLHDDIEISWGCRPQPGGEDARFPLENGLACVPVALVGTVLDQVLAWSLDQPALTAQPWFGAYRTAVQARTDASAPQSWISWHLDGAPVPGPLTRIFQRVRESARAAAHGLPDALFGEEGGTQVYLPVLAPPVAMFGTLAPQISEAAAATLLGIVADTWRPDGITHRLDPYVADQPAWRSASPYDQGYELAEIFLEDAGIDQSGARIDIAQALERLAITCRSERLGREGPRGVALAGARLAPTLVINLDHRANRHPKGRRFTLAHELCHILFDQGAARMVSHASTPWAPAAVEQRANAFAAMLLMPRPAVRRALALAPQTEEASSCGGVALEDVAVAAEAMEVGIRALINHLENLGEIDPGTRERMIAELDAASDAGGWQQVDVGETISHTYSSF